MEGTEAPASNNVVYSPEQLDPPPLEADSPGGEVEAILKRFDKSVTVEEDEEGEHKEPELMTPELLYEHYFYAVKAYILKKLGVEAMPTDFSLAYDWVEGPFKYEGYSIDWRIGNTLPKPKAEDLLSLTQDEVKAMQVHCLLVDYVDRIFERNSSYILKLLNHYGIVTKEMEDEFKQAHVDEEFEKHLKHFPFHKKAE